jgi:carbon dioxide concentrating mechanism protein CcmN
MSVPPLRLYNNFDSYMSGEVTIHSSAVIAPGVILQAAANSKIIIGPGVCIGMGSIFQAEGGTIEVEASASLGAGFLMVGQGQIGVNACIGAATTVFNCSVAAGSVVPPGSILGDTGRQVVTNALPPSPDNHTPPTSTQKPQPSENRVITSTSLSASAFVEFKQESISVTESAPAENHSATVGDNTDQTDSNLTEPNPEDAESGQRATESPNSFGTQIYGQGSIQRLLVTLFPHRQALNNPVSDNRSE